MHRSAPAIIAAVLVAASTSGATAQDAAAGEKVFNKCLPCHAVGEGAATKIGPQLNGLDGRKAGTVPGYTYTDAMKNSGIVWNEESFKKYIKSPATVVPGNKMFFPGLTSDQEIGNVWAYLKRFGPDGKIK